MDTRSHPSLVGANASVQEPGLGRPEHEWIGDMRFLLSSRIKSFVYDTEMIARVAWALVKGHIWQATVVGLISLKQDFCSLGPSNLHSLEEHYLGTVSCTNIGLSFVAGIFRCRGPPSHDGPANPIYHLSKRPVRSSGVEVWSFVRPRWGQPTGEAHEATLRAPLPSCGAGLGGQDRVITKQSVLCEIRTMTWYW